MKITLNEDEVKAAIELYVREKCIRITGYGWEISEIELTLDRDDEVATILVDPIDPAKIAPAPCAPACPPRAY